MIKLESIISDGMILQAGKPVRIFGWSDETDSGKTVKAEIDGCFGECVIDENERRWLIELAPHGYGEGYTLNVECGEQILTVNDIAFGDVFLCSGQSNMQFTMEAEVTPASEYVTDDMLRMFSATRPEANNGWKSSDGWVKCDKSEVDRWSALGYLIGVRHRKASGHAVGIILAAQGAAVIQSFMSEKALDNPLFDIPDELLFIDHHYEPYTWNGRSVIYHGMIEPLLPYSFKLVVWYQGESNASPAEGKVYIEMLRAMTDCWREADSDKTLPFIIIQIADTRTDEGWLAIQRAQLDAETIPYVKLVKCADICERNDIHPATKRLLADRIESVINSL